MKSFCGKIAGKCHHKNGETHMTYRGMLRVDRIRWEFRCFNFEDFIELHNKTFSLHMSSNKKRDFVANCVKQVSQNSADGTGKGQKNTFIIVI